MKRILLNIRAFIFHIGLLKYVFDDNITFEEYKRIYKEKLYEKTGIMLKESE